MNETTLIILDDEPEIADFIRKIARTVGLQAEATSSYEDFAATLERTDPICVILDLQMPDVDGIEVLRRLAERGYRRDIIIMSGFDQKVIDSAMHLGRERGLRISGMLRKPCRVDEVASILNGLAQSDEVIDPVAIGKALNEGQFTLFYQPKISLTEGYSGPEGPYRVTGFEALLRWKHPHFGMIGPDRFLELAERNGLMDQVTDYVIDAALRQIRAWADSGIDTTVAINVSAHNLHETDFADRLDARCKERGVRTASLIVELTETAAMSDPVMAMDILTRLRIKGVRLAIDDFGTGYSSLVQLMNLPFSQLKIDRAFVNECHRSQQSGTIVKTMIDLSKNLGLISVAEGVEDPESIEFVRACGCDIAQGFAISKPLPAEEAARWYRAHCKVTQST
ncbi:EAL domain-containing response regulator [Marivibrio halodurans]|uniref:EAL domain-containing response regulator n=1 Tax=Marivibrio halodurans TaxID=2039722 RepID=A0A8J7SKG0_9PROT|nr:EAL domain-containing response regulator [Marivibrio halodurans]MBP5856188.1 EAL domain-containing response regulator [Marivibrio halodurans]